MNTPLIARRRRTTVRAGIAGVSAAMVCMVPAARSLAGEVTTPEPPSPSIDDLEVVAQSVIEFDGGPYHWTITPGIVQPDTDDMTFAPDAPAFFVVIAGVVIATDPDGVGLLRMGAGEATFIDAGSETALSAAGNEPTSYQGIELASGEPAGEPTDAGDPFTPPQGQRDVDLARGVIAPGETLAIPDAEAAPVLLLVTDGSVTVASDGNADDTTLGVGEARTLDGGLTISNAGEQPAAVVAAIIGPIVEIDTSPTTTSTTTTTTTTTLTPATTVPPLPVPQSAPPEDGSTEPRLELGSVEIPRLGLTRQLFEGIRLATLDNGPGHWPGTAMPGEVGNVVIAGHRVSHNRDFRDIDQLVAGDEVIMATASGRHVYRVVANEVVMPDAIRIIDQTPGRTATLFACHPPGSVRERIVVHLELAP